MGVDSGEVGALAAVRTSLSGFEDVDAMWIILWNGYRSLEKLSGKAKRLPDAPKGLLAFEREMTALSEIVGEAIDDSSPAGTEGRNLTDATPADRRGKAESKSESEKKSEPLRLPKNPDVTQLARFINSQRETDRKASLNALALEFTAGDERRAESLLRSLRTFKHLLEPTRKSDFLCYLSHDGEQADFHALRHTYLSRLGRSGATPKVMQMLARHSDLGITIGRYGHASLHDLASAVDGLPPLPASDPQTPKQASVILRATGTDQTMPGATQVTESPDRRSNPTKIEACFEADRESILFPQVTQSHIDGSGKSPASSEVKTPESLRKTGDSWPAGKRRGGDSNPREACTPTSFRD